MRLDRLQLVQAPVQLLQGLDGGAHEVLVWKKNPENIISHLLRLYSAHHFTPWSRVLAACRGRSPRSSRSPRGRRGCVMAALSGRGLQRGVAAGRVSAEGAHMLLDLSHISSTTFAIKHQLSILHFWFPLYSLGNVQVNSLRL